MKRLGYRNQRTISRAVEIEGVGFLTGKTVHMRFRPAPGDTGVVFMRTDLGPDASISAHIDNVTGTHRRTTLGKGPAEVGLVEHVLAAMGGMHIDNCFVDLDAPEPPGMDGSALAFVAALGEAGPVSQKQVRAIWGAQEAIVVRAAGVTLGLYAPREMELRTSYFLHYGHLSPIQPQTFTCQLTPETFATEIAPCRTFVLQEEALELKNQGLGSNTDYKDLLVFGPQGPVENQVRFANEPARHKVLDMIGDLFLLGHDVCGHLVACRSGHPLNIELVRALHRQMSDGVPQRKLASVA